tara:strand:+ start:517 stop:2253 length:1737 start_codon:yes stop_codon:yes gene_type:complete
MVEKIGIEVEVKSKGASAAFKELGSDISNFNKSLDKNRDAVSAFDSVTGGAVTKARNMSKSIKGAAVAIKGFNASLSLTKKAILATGIGVLVVALGAVIAYWDDIKSIMSGVSSEQKNILENQTKTTENAQKNLDMISATENILKQQGKTDKDILKLKIAQTNETIKALEAQLETQIVQRQEAKEQAMRMQGYLSGLIQFVVGPIGWIMKAYDKLTGSNTSQIFDKMASLAFSAEDEDADQAIEDAKKNLTKLKNMKAGFENSVKAKDKANREKDKKEEEEAEKAKAEAIERIRKGLIDTEAKERADKLKQIEDDYKEQIALAEKYYGIESDKVLELRAAQKIKEDEQQALFDEQDEKKELDAQTKRLEELQLAKETELEDFQIQRDLLAEQRQLIIDDELLSDDQKNEALRANSEASEKITDQEYAAKRATILGYAQSLAQFSDILGKETAAGKALAIASTLFSTYQGASDALKDETIPNTFARVAAVGTVLATGFKQVKGIMSTQVPGGSGVSSPVMDTSVASAPSFNVVGQGGTSQLASAIADQQAAPSRSYVVAQDVTTAQALERSIIDSASLG